jgi:hypothetical protein
LNTLDECKELACERVSGWLLQNEAVPSTPVIMVNLIHSERGGLIVNIMEGMSFKEAIQLLNWSVKELEKKSMQQDVEGN